MSPQSEDIEDENLPPKPGAGCVVWLTGLSGAGKSTLATALHRELSQMRVQSCVLDGDVMRRGLCSDLGFSPGDRKENIRRVAHVGALFADAGLVCISAFISPYRAERALARSLAPEGRFIEVHISAPLEVCERRDPKHLYAKARAGELRDFTGISAPYEAPLAPEVDLRTDKLSVAECLRRLVAELAVLGCIRGAVG